MNGDEVLKGYDLSAIYENNSNVEHDDAIYKIKDQSMRI